MPAWGSARRVKPFHGNVADGTAAPDVAAVSVQRAPVLGQTAGARARQKRTHLRLRTSCPIHQRLLERWQPSAVIRPVLLRPKHELPRRHAARERERGCLLASRYACACARPRCRSSSNPRTRTTRGQDKARFGGSSQPGVLLFLRRLPRFFLVVAGSPARNVVNGARVGVHCLERARPGRRDPGRHRVSGTRAGARSQMERRHPKGGVHGARELQRTGGPRR